MAELCGLRFASSADDAIAFPVEWKLTPRCAMLLASMYRRSPHPIGMEEARRVIGKNGTDATEGAVYMQIGKLRRQLKSARVPVEVNCAFGHSSYYIPAASRDYLRKHIKSGK